MEIYGNRRATTMALDMRVKYLTLIKMKFFFILILNSSDLVFSKILLKTGLFYEGNIFMRNIIADNLKSIGFKILLPCILILYINLRIKSADVNQLKYSNIIVNACIIFYIIVNICHLIFVFIYNLT